MEVGCIYETASRLSASRFVDVATSTSTTLQVVIANCSKKKREEVRWGPHCFFVVKIKRELITDDHIAL